MTNTINSIPVQTGPLSITVRPALVGYEAAMVEGVGMFAIELDRPRRRFALLILEEGKGPQIAALYDDEHMADEAAQELRLALPQAVRVAREGGLQ
ncbi:hypothetical protein [Martelella sp. FOR1707]